jgi:ubiquinone/menaquinone biosynthesis C-methylase UbiE
MAGARAIITATQLGVLAALAQRPAGAEELADRLELDRAGTEALLAALAALGYVCADARGVYRATSAASQLIPGASGSVAHFVGAYNAHAWEMLGHLDEVLTLRRAAASHARAAGDPFWEAYIRGLFELTRREHEDNARLVPVSDPRTLLDVAGGHGAFAMAMCARFPDLQATVLDLPASVAVGRRVVAEQGFDARVSFRRGDALSDPLGEDVDVISIFNLLHHLAPAQVQGLLQRARAALCAGGCLVIGETEHNEPGEAPSLVGAASAIVYLASSGTRNYSSRELRAWLRQAGFAGVEVHRAQRSPWRLLYLATA